MEETFGKILIPTCLSDLFVIICDLFVIIGSSWHQLEQSMMLRRWNIHVQSCGVLACI